MTKTLAILILLTGIAVTAAGGHVVETVDSGHGSHLTDSIGMLLVLGGPSLVLVGLSLAIRAFLGSEP